MQSERSALPISDRSPDVVWRSCLIYRMFCSKRKFVARWKKKHRTIRRERSCGSSFLAKSAKQVLNNRECSRSISRFFFFFRTTIPIDLSRVNRRLLATLSLRLKIPEIRRPRRRGETIRRPRSEGSRASELSDVDAEWRAIRYTNYRAYKLCNRARISVAAVINRSTSAVPL